MKGHTKIRTLTFLVAAVFVAGLPLPAAAQEMVGTWETHLSGDAPAENRIQINMRANRGRGNHQNGFSVDLDRLEGLSSAAARGTARDVVFQLVREAGTVTFEGDFRDGRGTGFFTFVANEIYVQAMAELGYGGMTAPRVYEFALHNVTTEYVRGLRGLGYVDLSEDDLSRFAIHGVRLAYISGMNELGYTSISAEDLVRMRIHGVSLDYVREIRSALR